MATYAFQINLEGNTLQGFKQLENDAAKFKKGTENATESVNHLGESMKELGKMVIAAFAIEKVFEFGKELMNVTAEFEGYENRVKFASLSTEDAAINMQFLRQETEALHLPMRQVYESFSEMQAGLKDTGVEGEHFRKLFEGVSIAAATLHLPDFQLQRVFYDLKEIGELGAAGVSGIPARIGRSLSTALPGINALVKKIYGVTMMELNKEGVNGVDFLKKLGPGLKKYFESGLANWSGSLQARMNDTKTAFVKFQRELGEKLKPQMIEILDNLTKLFGILTKGALKFIDVIKDLWPVLKYVVDLFLIWKGLQLFDYLVTGIATFIKYMASLPKLILEAAAGFNSWTIGLIGSLVSIGLIYQLVEKIKHLGTGENYEESLAKPYRAESDSAVKEQMRLKPGLAAPTDTIKYNQAVLREKEASSKISDIMGSNGPFAQLYAIQLEQVKKVFKGLAEKLDILPKIPTGGSGGGGGGGAGLKENAFNTSALSGAAGGLGEAKIIKIDFHSPLMQVNMPGGNGMDVVAKAPMTIEMFLRLINNLSQSQGSTM